jgi:hypothetical protein
MATNNATPQAFLEALHTAFGQTVWRCRFFALVLLAIMLLLRNMPRGAALRRSETSSLLLGHHSIGLGLVFDGIDMVLLFVQPVRLVLAQLAAGNPLIDPPFLVGLALIDGRRVRCRERQRSP